MSGLLKLRIEPGDASETWKRSEGRVVGGKFPLLKYLAGSDDSAVFLTSITVGPDSREAAIKLIYAGTTEVEKQLDRWTAARELKHSNLLRIFDSGRCEIESMNLLYVAEEYADENLAQILPERALTAEETQELLPPILDALQYLHEQGFVHGHLRPSNILAIGNQVKLSSDALVRVGEKRPAATATTTNIYDPPEGGSGAVSAVGDSWQLGVTLIEVLTQKVPVWDCARSKAPEIPKSVPEPYREMARNCLRVEPGKRWTIAQIRNGLTPGAATGTPLESRPPALALVQGEAAKAEKIDRERARRSPVAVAASHPSAKWPYVLVVAVLLAIAVALVVRSKTEASHSAVQSVQPSVAVTEPPQGGQSTAQTTSPQNVTANPAPNEASSFAGDGIAHRVVPDISASARRTIHGRIVVRVKVRVDAAGNVSKTSLQSGRGSRYFSRVALESAREWKFMPASATGETGGRDWILQFAFTRATTDVSAAASSR
jgi:TonB family protein